MQKRNIYIYTSLYPFSLMAESFLGEELRIGADLGLNITVIPIGKDRIIRDLPANVYLDDSICNRGLWLNMKAVIRLLKPSYIKVILFDKSRPNEVKYWIDTVKYLYAAGLVYHNLNEKVRNNKSAIFYSYWLSYGPIAFADYKKEHPNTEHKFISRAHTFASIDTSRGVYYPMRDYAFKYIDQVYVISSILLEELRISYPDYKSKFYLSRLGVKDNIGENKTTSEYVEIVSCSSMIPLKRVNLIYDSINQYSKLHQDRKIRWTHIGSGPLGIPLRQQVKKECANNLFIDLKGGMMNKQILEYYSHNRIRVFVLLSETEGVPVAIMEAISSGIPVLATNVGGIKDIVTQETGRLIEKNFAQEEFNKAMDSILSDPLLPKTAHDFYCRYFNSEHNYSRFYESVLKS